MEKIYKANKPEIIILWFHVTYVKNTGKYNVLLQSERFGVRKQTFVDHQTIGKER